MSPGSAPRGAEWWATKIEGDVHHLSRDAMFMVWKEPMGVAVGITPWNYLMMMATQKLAAALAAGCTSMLKPREQSPLTCLELPKKAMRTAQAIRAEIVWINDTQPAPTEMPWGGYKQSGVGRELGKDGVEDFLERKSVYLNLG